MGAPAAADDAAGEPADGHAGPVGPLPRRPAQPQPGAGPDGVHLEQVLPGGRRHADPPQPGGQAEGEGAALGSGGVVVICCLVVVHWFLWLS